MEQTLKGTIISGDEFEPVDGYLTIEDGVIKEIEEKQIASDTIIAPCFVNAHTHIGDAVIKDPPFLPLEELVKPPHGLKHRVLSKTSYSTIVDAMDACIKDMIKTGTCFFADFREGGVEGARALRDALGTNNIEVRIFGRPLDKDMSYLDLCDGTGLSSTNDLSPKTIKETVGITREKRKKFAIHAGERDPSDITPALELAPDFLIHLTHAGNKELKAISEANIPVVVCLRSNLITGSGLPPVKKMLDEGILVAAGTDNVMLNSVNMFSEMEFLAKTNLFDDRQVFKLCTLNGAKILGIDNEIGSIKQGKKAKLMLLTKNSNNMQGIRNPLGSLVRRARPDDIIGII
ncbi:MAG: amidohydrolase family protein [Euryarchaeota archaeon]|nr:amidohydrolase family protein [Euryarchaeota archaeon]MBU4491386.1 amidohydrolase family protein [Euryarchaeota archaeon]MCG2727585.1 amidohydrolase family protein [Candidatus Methanoperedenaceae archaeon]